MSKKYKKTCKDLNYVEQLLILASTVAIPVGITSSAIGIKNCAIAPGIEVYKSIIKKKKKSMIKQCCSEKIS